MIETTIRFEGKPVKVQATFYYPEKHLNLKDQNNVFCRISVLTDELNEKGNHKWKLFSEGRARRKGSDKFNKARGRKNSFNSAVKQIKEKEIRTILWEAFIHKFGTN